MLNKLAAVVFSLVFLATLSGCDKHAESTNILRVGTIAGPETQLIEVAKTVAKQQYQLDVEIIEFNDYNTPNLALNDGSIDANVFQHQPYLTSVTASRGYHLVSAGKVFIYPMAIYSKKLHSLEALPEKGTVAIPNDPSNEARALRLLQQAHLITLKDPNSITATPHDIAENSKQLSIKELDAAQLPRVLPDVDLAVINTNFAMVAGLTPKHDGLVVEDHSSPYANIVAVKQEHLHDEKVQQLLAALHSTAVVNKAHALFGESAIPAW